jgi:ribosome recycling factor
MNLDDKKQEFKKAVEHLKTDVGSVRTGTATPALVENIVVDIYGSKMTVSQVASISSPEPKQLLVEPWDKTQLKEIEKAIQTASLGFSVNNEGNHLRLIIPPMTEESRKQIIKMLNDKLEQGRVAMRGVRDNIKEEILEAEKQKEISEDEKFRLLEDLDKMTREHTEMVNEIGKHKEEEIMI